MSDSRPDHAAKPPEGNTATYCDCYGDTKGAPLCDECRADERERDEKRSTDLFMEGVMLYGI